MIHYKKINIGKLTIFFNLKKFAIIKVFRSDKQNKLKNFDLYIFLFILRQKCNFLPSNSKGTLPPTNLRHRITYVHRIANRYRSRICFP